MNMTHGLGTGQVDRKSDGTTELKLDKMAVIARGMFEYSEMFNLEKDGVIKRLLDQPGASVLDIPGSTSTFAFQLRRMAERSKSDLSVISSDIVYDTPSKELYDAAMRTAKTALQPLLTENTWEGQVWVSNQTPFHTPADLLHYREATYKAWLEDFERNRGSYITDSFPYLSNLEGRKFDLIVSGNCLFAYADKLFGNNQDEIYAFHEQSVLSMANLLAAGGELRIYPIGTASVPVYPKLQELLDRVVAEGYLVSIDAVERPPNVANWDRVLRITKAG
jgi:hypothetical protein